jgi:hypothetical protein
LPGDLRELSGRPTGGLLLKECLGGH